MFTCYFQKYYNNRLAYNCTNYWIIINMLLEDVQTIFTMKTFTYHTHGEHIVLFIFPYFLNVSGAKCYIITLDKHKFIKSISTGTITFFGAKIYYFINFEKSKLLLLFFI